MAVTYSTFVISYVFGITRIALKRNYLYAIFDISIYT